MASTLIIGIGTTGLNIIEEAQQWHYEFTGKNKPGDMVEYLFFETDIHKKPAITPTGESSISAEYLTLENNAAVINRLKSEDGIDNKWVPEIAEVLKQGNGAGGMSSYGRLSLWGADNFSKVKNAILQKYQKINGNSTTNIIIVGTLSGGTGSGLCIDIAYLTRRLTKCKNINGVFVLPDNASLLKNKTLFENAYCALASLDFYTKTENKYIQNWPNGVGEIADDNPPYSQIHFASQDFANANAPCDFNELIKITGLQLLLMFIDTDIPGRNYINQQIGARHVDGIANRYSSTFNTYGLKMIQYPKSQIEELLSITFAKNILNEWTNTEKFIDGNNNPRNIQAILSPLSNSVSARFEKIVAKAFERIDSITSYNGLNLSTDIENQIKNVIEKNTQSFDTSRFIYSLFTTQNNCFFTDVKNNSLTMRDAILTELSDYIKQVSDEYRNLNITQIVLKEIANNCKSLSIFHKEKYGITGDDADWDSVLQKAIKGLLSQKNSYNIVLQQKNYVAFIFENILTLLKIHTVIKELKVIQNAIITGDVITSSNGDVLPTITEVESIIKMIKNTINVDNSLDIKSLQKREDQIRTHLSKRSTSFFYVYESGSLDTDITLVMSNYNNNIKSKITGTTITANKSLWEYLSEMNRRDQKSNLYTDSIKNIIEFVKRNNLISNDYDVIKIINKLSLNEIRNKAIFDMYNGNLDYIRTNLPALVSLRQSEDLFSTDPTAPLFVFNNNSSSNGTILPNVPNAPQEHIYKDSMSINNTIVFYQEYGYLGEINGIKTTYNPVINNEFVLETKKHIKKVYNSKFKMEHIPYLTEDQFKNNYLN